MHQPFVDAVTEIARPPSWARDALCREFASDANWFPDRGEPSEPAKAVCARCSVVDDCLEYALSNGISEGIWGATSGRERRQIHAKVAKGATLDELLTETRTTRSTSRVRGVFGRYVPVDDARASG